MVIKNLTALALLFLSMLLVSCATGTATSEPGGLAIQTNTWALPMVGEYSFSIVDGVYYIHKRGSKGALQLSSMTKGSDIDEAELLSLATRYIANRAEITKISKNDFLGYKASFREGQVIWMNWFFAIKHSLVFITYNVDAKDLDENEVLEILGLIDGLHKVSQNRRSIILSELAAGNLPRQNLNGLLLAHIPRATCKINELADILPRTREKKKDAGGYF